MTKQPGCWTQEGQEQANENKKNQQQPENPYNQANLVSRTLFWWLNPFIRLGFTKKLELNDLYKAPDEDSSEDLGRQLKLQWDKELLKVSSGDDKAKPSLVRALCRTFGFWYLLAGIWIAVGECLFRIMQAVSLGWLIRDANFYMNLIVADSTTDQEMLADAYWRVFYDGLYLILFSVITLISVHPHVYCCQHTGMKIRVAICQLVYRHALKLSHSALAQTTVGQMVNLLTNDVNRFDLGLIYMHFLIVAPLQAILAVILLSTSYLGVYATLAGSALFLLYVPFQTQMGRWFGELRDLTAIKTDERIRLMNEMIPAMRVIKMYCWEEPFAKLVDLSRRQEVALIRKTSILRGINMALFFVSSKLIVFLCLLTYILQGYTLDPEIVFVPITLFNSVRLLMTLFFPYAVAQLAEMLISCARLQEFLLLPEQEKSFRLIRRSSNSSDTDQSCGIECDDACANWNIIDKTDHSLLTALETAPIVPPRSMRAGTPTPVGAPPTNGDSSLGAGTRARSISTNSMSQVRLQSKAAAQQAATLQINKQQANRQRRPSANPETMAITVLRNINYDVRAGELMMIVGSVGSGKSSVLMSILGELPLVSGSIEVQGRVSYAAQEAWIFAGTVRQNVLFGKQLDEQRYRRVLTVCALDRDIEALPEGDQTLVGERGVSLSGGQRARVNLARAIYNEADIYLLDDPLSAVDTVVARHIFNECICGFLKDKAVVLATHQTQFVRRQTKVLFLQEGRQLSCKSYTDNTELQLFIGSNWEKSDSESAMSAGGGGGGAAWKGKGQHPRMSELIMSRSKSPGIGARRSMSPLPRTTREKDSSHDGDESNHELDSQSGDEDNFKETNESAKDDGSQIPPGADGAAANEEDDDEEPSAGLESGPSIYWYYVKASSSLLIVTLLALSNVGAQILFNGCDFWLSLWTDTEQRKAAHGGTRNYEKITITDRLSLEENAYVYTAIVGILFVITLMRTTTFFVACTRSSINLHDRLFRSILRAPIKFFDLNPIGNFLNRVSRDMGIVDDSLPPTAFDTIEILVNIVGTLIVNAIIMPINIVPAIALCTIVFVIRLLYLRTVRSLKTLESSTRSPIFSHLTASLNGLTTIRAFRVEHQFEAQFDEYQDVHSSAWYLFIASSRWLGMTLDWISLGYIGVVTIVLSLSTESVTGSQLGLAISSALLISGSFQWGIRQSTEWESQMTSVARIKEYSELPAEQKPGDHDDFDHGQQVKPGPEWPDKGAIEFKGVSLRYFDDKEPVLNQISFSVKPGERIGIVGRTGAGKSSLIAVLFRLTEPEGSILIDGLDICQMSLQDLRQKLSIIPQEPVLFNGTVRRNLDPFDNHAEFKLWQALEQVKLAQLIRSLPGALEAELSEGGSNFSVGERQLICLARAILRQNKIIILDEATANVDPNTDKFIQHTINQSFSGCTQLTIAHRLNTIMNSDRVLVMEAGQVREFDVPHLLLQKERGLFTTMVNNTGKNANHLRRIAKSYYDKRRARQAAQ